MSITQTFYDNLASQYDKLFLDWQATTQEQAVILDKIFVSNGFDKTAKILLQFYTLRSQKDSPKISLPEILLNLPERHQFSKHFRGQRSFQTLILEDIS